MAHPKGVLLERAAKLGLSRPEFRTERSGPEHEPLFLTDVILDGEVLGTGQGSSKRTAEKNAADEALAALEAREGGAAQGVRRGQRAGAAGAGAAGAADGTQAKRPAKTPRAASRAADEATREPADEQAGELADEPEEEPADEQRYQPAAEQEEQQEDEMASDEFDGPWPMFDDLLAAVLRVAEKRVATDLRGEAARAAIRDFSLALYKDLLSDLGDVVEDDGEEDEEEG